MFLEIEGFPNYNLRVFTRILRTLVTGQTMHSADGYVTHILKLQKKLEQDVTDTVIYLETTHSPEGR